MGGSASRASKEDQSPEQISMIHGYNCQACLPLSRFTFPLIAVAADSSPCRVKMVRLSVWVASLASIFAMGTNALKYTPEVLISAPRRDVAVPCDDGSKIVLMHRVWSLDTHSWTSDVRLLDTRTNETTVLTTIDAVSDLTFLGNDQVLILADATETGYEGAKVSIGNIANWDKTSYDAGFIDGSVANLKVKGLGDGSFIIAVSGIANPDGVMVNKENPDPRVNTGRLYSNIFVRHWDRWIDSTRKSIFYGNLKRDAAGQFKLSPMINALKGLGLESPLYATFSGTACYDISSTGLVFVVKDPAYNKATYTKCNVYLMALAGFDGTKALPAPYKVYIDGYDSYALSPMFSRDGKSVAFLQMKSINYEADRYEIFTIPDISKPSHVNHLVGSPEMKALWDYSPQSVAWNENGKMLFAVAEQRGREVLWTLSADPHTTGVPTGIFQDSSVSDFKVLSSGVVVISGDTLVSNSDYHIITPTASTKFATHLVSSNTRSGATLGISHSQVSEIEFQGANQLVHAWVIKPSDFQADKTYPLAYLIHGGPQSAWLDGWSNRWNPFIWAEQGYVVVLPNPTGSTGYGQAFCDAIAGQWGGLPYIDIEKGFEYIAANLSYVDTSRAVLLGASYGGYMANWVQGQPLGRKLKAIVAHDGPFSMTGSLATEELWFPEREFKGKFWDHEADWRRWDPSRHLQHWATPQLIVHSEKDYRVPVSEGLSAFNVLQERGVESQFLAFPDENHWVLGPENSLLWYTTVLDFVNKYVGLPLYSETSARAGAAKKEASVYDPKP